MSETKTLAVVQDDGEFSALMDSSRFDQCYRVARLFSCSDLVPEQFRGKPENCFIAMQMAVRMKIDPMMLMQSMYVVHGRPGIEAKLAIALMNKRGPFSGPVQFRMEGDGVDRKCTAFATHSTTGELCEATVTWAMVTAEGWDKPKGKPGSYQQQSKWMTLPELMFRYRSAMFLARLYCPEVLLGLSAVDELQDAIEVSGERIDEPPKTRTEALKDKLRASLPVPEQPASQATKLLPVGRAVSGSDYVPTIEEVRSLIGKGDMDAAKDLAYSRPNWTEALLEVSVAMNAKTGKELSA